MGAWLLGAAAATTGSLYAVDQLGQGLLEQHGKQFSIAMVDAQLALEHSEHSAQVTPSPSPPAKVSGTGDRARPLRGSSASPKATNSGGTLLTSSGGTAMAVCKPEGAYLVFWSPQQGYEADHVVQGPVLEASVVFRSSTGGGVVMKVTCSGSQPVEHLSTFGWGTGPEE